MDKEKRTICILGYIEESTINTAYTELLEMILDDDKEESEKKDFTRKPIKIYINTYGGSTYDMWAFVDLMMTTKTPIHTYCTGYCMSAGFIIFIAGDKRFATPHATFMNHQLSHDIFGKYKTLMEKIEEDKYLFDIENSFVLSRTKISEEMLNECNEKKKDWYIHAEEALKLGIVDEIIAFV